MSDLSELVRYQVSDRVATVTLDSPHNRNALSAQLMDELSARLSAAGEDPAVRAVVLTHTGRVFCSGADLAAAGAGSLGEAGTAITGLLRLIVELPKPVIARLAGHVRAGGMGIVGACDLAVAAEGASFAFTEARIGVAPAMISLTTLDIMDPRQAMRYYLTGETFGAPEAERLGLVTAACAGAELDAVVDGLVAPLLETSPQGAAETKKLLTAPRRQRLDALGPEMTELSARLFASEEAQEGIRAFLEKRLPAWRRPRLRAAPGGTAAQLSAGLAGRGLEVEQQDAGADGARAGHGQPGRLGHRVGEQALALAQDDREDHQPVLIDQPVLGQGVHQLGAALDEQVAAGLVLDRRDLGRDVAAQHGGVAPGRFAGRQGARYDVLMDAVHPLAEVIAAHARPRRGEPLVGDPAEQERPGLEQFLVLELIAFRAAVKVKGPPGLFHHPVERHELGDHDLSHVRSSRC